LITILPILLLIIPAILISISTEYIRQSTSKKKQIKFEKYYLNINDEIVYEEACKCETLTSTTRSMINWKPFYFENTKVSIMSSAIILRHNYYKKFWRKGRATSIIITNQPNKYEPIQDFFSICLPTKINTNSFNGAVHIETQPDLLTDYYFEVRLLELSNEAKKWIDKLLPT